MSHTQNQQSKKSVNGTLKVIGMPSLHYFTQQAKDLAKDLSIDIDVTDKNFLQELVKRVPIQAEIKTKDNKVTYLKVVK